MEKVSYRVAGRLVKVDIVGNNPGDAILDAVRAGLLQAGGDLRPCLLMVDARRATTSRPTTEVRSIASRFIKLAPMVERLAVVTETDFHYGLARVALTISESDLVAAAACRSLDQACSFLGVDPRDILPEDSPSLGVEPNPRGARALPDAPSA